MNQFRQSIAGCLLFVATLGVSLPALALVGPIAPAATQPAGALSGRIVFTSGGHGWTANGTNGWFLQRDVLNEMDEDYGNVDQMTMFVYYCFNAGATVVPMRPVGNQTNEVVLDNDDPGVTFSGTWNNSSSTVFFGSFGDVPYRYAALTNSETATATYIPNIPLIGFYPVYTWVRAGTDRGDQLYRIRHTGGESQVRVPHYLVGSGWIYLGTYYFNAGSNVTNGAVVISNLRSTTNGVYTFADAIRFGNGMGDVDRGSGVSTYPREEECSRYWVQRMVGQGQLSSLYDGGGNDQSDNVGAPIRMAAEMNFTNVVPSIYKRIYISFHSNSSTDNPNTATGRGCTGLYNDDANFPGTSTPNQLRLATLISYEVNSNMYSLTVPPLEVGWNNNRSSLTTTQTFAFGEIRGDVLNDEMDATIIEVAFHDNTNDSRLLRDPKVRNTIARSAYQSVVHYMNEFDGAPFIYLPEPPFSVRAVAATNGVTISWAPPVSRFGSGAPMNYVVYRSTDGYGFGNSTSVGGTATNITLTNVTADIDFCFRVAAVNGGGESLPSETVGCRRSSVAGAARVLFVNAFDRFERSLNLRQTPAEQNYKPPGHNNNSGTMDRVVTRGNNTFDYVVQHGKALSSYGMAFDSCQNENVSAGQANLSNYFAVIWACGNESTADETFSSAEQTKISSYLAGGGNLFASGAEIAWDLDRSSGPTAADRTFIHTWLHASYTNDDSGSYTVVPVTNSIFAGHTNAIFDDGSKGIYYVGFPDVLMPFGSGASAALNYSGVSIGSAAIQYNSSAGGGKVVYFGLPFETITTATARATYMADILRFFIKQPRFESIALESDQRPHLVLSGEPGIAYPIQVSSNLATWTTWTNIFNATGLVEFTDAPAADGTQRFYRAVLSP